MLRCADDTLYTGITVDVEKRVHQHNTSYLGAKYTRGKRPVKLVYQQHFASRSIAQIEEVRIKRLSRTQKLALAGLHN